MTEKGALPHMLYVYTEDDTDGQGPYPIVNEKLEKLPNGTVLRTYRRHAVNTVVVTTTLK